MERLVLIGVSHRRGGADALERWQTRFGGDAALAAAGLEHGVVLATCNRWELALHLPPERTLDEVREALVPEGETRRPYAYVRDGAFERLVRIAAGLDSLNPGEDQIMRQVRAAYLEARDGGRTDKVLSFAFERALRAAKRVRREVALAPVRTSLFSLARADLEAILEPGAPVAVLGAGEMGELASRSLRDLGARVLLVNRDPRRAEEVAARVGAEPVALAAFRDDPPPLAALVCATPVPHLVDAAMLSRTRPRLVVDLGVPRNVDPAAARARGVRVLDVDTLQAAGEARRADLREKLAQADALVLEELDAALDEWAERELGPSIRRLRESYLDAVVGAAGALSEDEARRLAHRFAHVPIKGLRALAREHGIDVARTFLLETGLNE